MNISITASATDDGYAYQPTQAPRSRRILPYTETPVLQPDGSYNCPSGTYTLEYYNVKPGEHGWVCPCLSFVHSGVEECKHTRRIDEVLAEEKARYKSHKVVSLESLFEV